MIKLKDLLTEIDDEKIIKYKDKDGKPGEMKAGSAKTMEKGHPAKIAWDKMAEKDSEGGDDKKDDSQKVSFDRTAGNDTDSKSDYSVDGSAGKGQKVVDGKITIGEDDNTVEVDVEDLANTLNIPGIDAKTLAKKFESGDAGIDADSDGRIDFSFYDDKIGDISAQVENDGHYDFDAQSSSLSDDQQEEMRDGLEDLLKHQYHDDIKPEDEGEDYDNDEDMDDDDDENMDASDEDKKQEAAGFSAGNPDRDPRFVDPYTEQPTRKTEYKGSLEYKFEDEDKEFYENLPDEDEHLETLPKAMASKKWPYSVMHPKKKLQQVAKFLKRGKKFDGPADISDEDVQFVRDTFYNDDKNPIGQKMEKISDERLRIGIMQDLDNLADGNIMKLMSRIVTPEKDGEAYTGIGGMTKGPSKYKLDDKNWDIFDDSKESTDKTKSGETFTTYSGDRRFMTKAEREPWRYKDEKTGKLRRDIPIKQDYEPKRRNKTEGMIKLKSLLKK
jgi:hypothetical protein